MPLLQRQGTSRNEGAAVAIPISILPRVSSKTTSEQGGTVSYVLVPKLSELSSSSEDLDPFDELPWLANFMFGIVGFVLLPERPLSKFARFLYRWRIPNWIGLLQAVISVTLNALSGSLLLVPNICQLIEWVLAATTFHVLRSLVPVWRSLYAPGAPEQLVAYRRKLASTVSKMAAALIALLLIVFLVWLYVLYSYVYLVYPFKDTATLIYALDSIWFGVYCMVLIIGPAVGTMYSRLLCLLHEAQLELLLRAFRTRQHDPALSMLAPSADIPLLPRFFGLFTHPDKTYTGREDPKAITTSNIFSSSSSGSGGSSGGGVVGGGGSGSVPLSMLTDMYLNVQASMDYTATMMRPLTMLSYYGMTFLLIYFFVLSLRGNYAGIVYEVAFFFVAPLTLLPASSVNDTWGRIRLQIEKSLSMYTAEESVKITSMLAYRPLQYKPLLSSPITYTTIGVAMHVTAVPAVVSFVLWASDGFPLAFNTA